MISKKSIREAVSIMKSLNNPTTDIRVGTLVELITDESMVFVDNMSNEDWSAICTAIENDDVDGITEYLHKCQDNGFESLHSKLMEDYSTAIGMKATDGIAFVREHIIPEIKSLYETFHEIYESTHTTSNSLFNIPYVIDEHKVPVFFESNRWRDLKTTHAGLKGMRLPFTVEQDKGLADVVSRWLVSNPDFKDVLTSCEVTNTSMLNLYSTKGEILSESNYLTVLGLLLALNEIPEISVGLSASDIKERTTLAITELINVGYESIGTTIAENKRGLIFANQLTERRDVISGEVFITVHIDNYYKIPEEIRPPLDVLALALYLDSKPSLSRTHLRYQDVTPELGDIAISTLENYNKATASLHAQANFEKFKSKVMEWCIENKYFNNRSKPDKLVDMFSSISNKDDLMYSLAIAVNALSCNNERYIRVISETVNNPDFNGDTKLINSVVSSEIIMDLLIEQIHLNRG